MTSHCVFCGASAARDQPLTMQLHIPTLVNYSLPILQTETNWPNMSLKHLFGRELAACCDPLFSEQISLTCKPKSVKLHYQCTSTIFDCNAIWKTCRFVRMRQRTSAGGV